MKRNAHKPNYGYFQRQFSFKSKNQSLGFSQIVTLVKNMMQTTEFQPFVNTDKAEATNMNIQVLWDVRPDQLVDT